MWMMPLHLHVNQKSDYDYDDMIHEAFSLLHVKLMKRLDVNRKWHLKKVSDKFAG